MIRPIDLIYAEILVANVVGPGDGGKRYIAFRNIGGCEEWYCNFAPINVFAPDGSVKVVGNVMWANEPKVKIAHPPTVAW